MFNIIRVRVIIIIVIIIIIIIKDMSKNCDNINCY